MYIHCTIKFWLLSLTTFIFAFERGGIVSVEEISYESLTEIQQNLNNDLDGLVDIQALYGSVIYRVVYQTVDGYGDSSIASGVMAIPESDNEAFGIISWQHGTQIYRDGVQSNSGFDILSRAVASTGYVYIAADFLGLGISIDIHPYIIKTPSANTVIDLIRAVRNYFENDIYKSLNRQLSLIGYSEGGYATLATQMVMEQELSDEFDITISFPMAGPYDLSNTMVDKMLEDDIYGEPFYLPYLIYSYITYYEIMGSIEEYFLPEFSEIVDEQYGGSYGAGYLNNYMNENSYNPPKLCLKSDVISDFESNENHILRQILEENDIYDWIPESETYLFHAIADELIPYQNSLVAYNQFIDNGSQSVYLELLPESFGGHQDAAPYAILTAYSLIEQIKQINHKGDINHDSDIDVLDIISGIDIILLIDTEIDDYKLWAADYNSDTIIDILDIVNIVNYILF